MNRNDALRVALTRPLPQASEACAYERCQAGGVILPGAPRINATVPPRRDASVLFHPGCWAARQHWLRTCP